MKENVYVIGGEMLGTRALKHGMLVICGEAMCVGWGPYKKIRVEAVWLR